MNRLLLSALCLTALALPTLAHAQDTCAPPADSLAAWLEEYRSVYRTLEVATELTPRNSEQGKGLQELSDQVGKALAVLSEMEPLVRIAEVTTEPAVREIAWEAYYISAEFIGVVGLGPRTAEDGGSFMSAFNRTVRETNRIQERVEREHEASWAPCADRGAFGRHRNR
ncbi:hypothetical protein [Rubricoccus marinus]|uniref:Imelysin-like domain-containing protein n=1 Tax=Rubricoccus marinus TaxID=716817 RepID=A0A259U213_9BACT|nr:hypothetical protein [Rubricoccus marinus]OZC04022.1 hypothetical protein BSZ36_14140 [Rubricoccus marinus]